MQLNHGHIDSLLTLTRRAGEAIMATRDGASSLKEDGSLVTAADYASNDVLISGIKSLFGNGVGILSEEVGKDAAGMATLRQGLTVVIDPLDGTSNFKNGSPEYAVLLALLVDSRPVYGIATIPAYGISVHGGLLTSAVHVYDHKTGQNNALSVLAQRTDINAAPDKAALAVPRRFWESQDADVGPHIREIVSAFTQVAGEREIVPASTIFSALTPFIFPHIHNRLYSSQTVSGGAGDWDVAAWNAMALALGGCLTNLAGEELRYLTGNKHSNYCYHQTENARKAYHDKALKSAVLRRFAYA